MIQNLMLSLELDSISVVTFDADHLWHVHAQCCNCHDILDLFCRVSVTTPIHNSRGEANSVFKCKACGRHGYVKMRSCGEPVHYTAEQSGRFQILASFESRNVLLTEWIPDPEQTTAWGLSPTARFTPVDVAQEFYDYDEEAGVPVSITEFQSRLDPVKH